MKNKTRQRAHQGANKARSQLPLLPLEDSGRGLWGRNSTRTLHGLRDEWNR